MSATIATQAGLRTGAGVLVDSLEAQWVKRIFGMRRAKIDRVFDKLLDSLKTSFRSQRRTHDMGNSGMVERRSILKAAAAFGGLSTIAVIAPAIPGAAQESEIPAAASPEVKLEDVLAGPNTKLTIERRGRIVLLGINRPYIQNRIDPETFEKLAEAYYQYDNDPSLRAAILFGHGQNFSRGIDVEGFKSLAGTGQPWIANTETIAPLAKRAPHLTKPLIAVTHGDTWNMAHELFLVADIRIASADTRFGQDENTHGRFPGGGSTVRFVREAGWGNAMRYMLTGGTIGMLKKRIGSERCSKLRQHQKRRWRQEFRSQTRSPRVGHSELKQHCFPPILRLIPPKPTLCPDLMPSLAHSFTRETFRRDEKLKLKGVRRRIRVDDPCVPLGSPWLELWHSKEKICL